MTTTLPFSYPSAGAAVGFKTRFLAIRINSDSEFYAPQILDAAGEFCAAFVLDVIKQIHMIIPAPGIDNYNPE